eukprot:sb/3464346/
MSQQQLWLQIQVQYSHYPMRSEEIQKETKLTVPIRVSIYAYTNDTKILLNEDPRSHDRQLMCYEGVCDPVTVFHLSYIRFPRYYIEVETSQALVNRSSFTRYTFSILQSKWLNLETKRFFFLITAFLTALALVQSLRGHSLQDWSIEQKWIIFLLIAVMLYDNPLFPLLLLTSTPLISVVDAVFTVTFFCSLLMFWLCVYHGMRKAERHFFSFYFLKLCLVGLIWIIGCVVLSWSALYETVDPTFSITQDQEGFTIVKIFFFVLLAIYIFYLLFLLVRAYSELHSMPYFDVRLRFLTTLTVIILLISLVAMSLRFGRAFLERDIVMEITLRWNNAAEFLCFYSLFNFYLFTLAFVYSPSTNIMGPKESTSFAMLSDSEDEVLYRGGKQGRYMSTAGQSYDVDLLLKKELIDLKAIPLPRHSNRSLEPPKNFTAGTAMEKSAISGNRGTRVISVLELVGVGAGIKSLSHQVTSG